MNKKEKRQLAKKMLKRNGYSDEEIAKILRLSFDKKEGKEAKES